MSWNTQALQEAKRMIQQAACSCLLSQENTSAFTQHFRGIIIWNTKYSHCVICESFHKSKVLSSLNLPVKSIFIDFDTNFHFVLLHSLYFSLFCILSNLQIFLTFGCKVNERVKLSFCCFTGFVESKRRDWNQWLKQGSFCLYSLV